MLTLVLQSPCLQVQGAEERAWEGVVENCSVSGPWVETGNACGLRPLPTLLANDEEDSFPFLPTRFTSQTSLPTLPSPGRIGAGPTLHSVDFGGCRWDNL